MRRRRRKDEKRTKRARPVDERAPQRRALERHDPFGAEARRRLDELVLEIAEEPKQAKHRDERSRLRLEVGDPVGALEDVRAWLEAAPQDARAHQRRGEVLLALEDAVGARDAFARAVNLDPAQSAYHVSLAQVRARLGDPRGALTCCDRAVGLVRVLDSVKDGVDRGSHPRKHIKRLRFLLTAQAAT